MDEKMILNVAIGTLLALVIMNHVTGFVTGGRKGLGGGNRGGHSGNVVPLVATSAAA